jgi:anti-sigma regulatory factor (Ser/Thr protein kinase)
MMTEQIRINYAVRGDDFTQAGTASADLKSRLRTMGFPADVIRKVTISLYEGEINLVIHAGGGEIEAAVSGDRICLVLSDSGPGIEDIELAKREGWSSAPDEIRSLGFGAGMCIPNMIKYSDSFDIQSTPGVGTVVTMEIMC